ncbi:MAG: GxxExxY protein, partial [Candidatus Saganbacteria bacterium]|nr:GxxExxY protein [Candidatus Saganbacteria bacterium]
DLTYKINGILFKVHNELGGGYQEKIYQSALRREFKNSGIKFTEQVWSNIIYDGTRINSYRLDFIIENK